MDARRNNTKNMCTAKRRRRGAHAHGVAGLATYMFVQARALGVLTDVACTFIVARSFLTSLSRKFKMFELYLSEINLNESRISTLVVQ